MRPADSMHLRLASIVCRKLETWMDSAIARLEEPDCRSTPGRGATVAASPMR